MENKLKLNTSYNLSLLKNTSFIGKRRESLIQSRMKFAEASPCQIKETLRKSDSFNRRISHVLEYGRIKKFKKLNLKESLKKLGSTSISPINIDDYESIQISENTELVKNNLNNNKKSIKTSTISSLNDKKQTLPSISNNHKNSLKMIFGSEESDPNLLSENLVGENETYKLQPKFKDINKVNYQIVKVDEQYVYSLKKKNVLLPKVEIGPQDENKKVPLFRQSQARKMKEDKTLQSCPAKFKAKKLKCTRVNMRDDSVLFSLKDSVEQMENIQIKIHQTLNDAYEGLLNREYEKYSQKMKKIINHQRVLHNIIDNKLLDKDKKTKLLSKIK